MSNILFLNFLDGLNSTNTVTFSEVLDGGYSSNVSFDGSVDGETSNERIEKRISSIVSKHIPEFIRTQNPLFVKFLRYYYEFLEQDFNAQELLQNINSYADIDKTVPSFVYYFLRNYGSKIPTSALIDKRFLIKKLNDLYQSKGSELSFQTLFRLLYDQEITINYPYENVLRASDGEFVSKFCVGISIEQGSIVDIDNRFLTYTYNGAEFTTPIVNAKLLPNDKAEIQIDAATKATNYIPGEFVYVYDKNKNILLKGNILPTINDYSVLTPGSDFKLGKVYSVNYGPATGSLLRVSKLTSNKGIAQVSFINFGYDYPDNLELNILPEENSAKTVEPKVSSTNGITDEFTILKVNNSDYFAEDYLSQSDYVGNPILFNYSFDELTDSVDNIDANNIPYYNITNVKSIRFTSNSIATTLTSNTLGTTDFFSANIINGSNGYSIFTNVLTSALVSNSSSYANIAGSNASLSIFLSNSYFSTIVNGNVLDFSNISSGTVSSEVCTLLLRTGGLAKYPGSYTSSKGFISESDILLQDNLLNQPFAYQVQSELDITRFYDVVIDLVHPSGYILFNKRNIRSNVDVSANVGTSFRETFTKLEAFDGVDASDVFSIGRYVEPFSDSITTSESVSISFSTALDDILNTVDNTIYTFSTTNNEFLDTSDDLGFLRNILLSDELQLSDNNSFAANISFIDEINNIEDISNNRVSFSVIDDLETTDNLSNTLVNLNILDEQLLEDNTSFFTTLTAFDDSVSSTVITTVVGGGTNILFEDGLSEDVSNYYVFDANGSYFLTEDYLDQTANATITTLKALDNLSSITYKQYDYTDDGTYFSEEYVFGQITELV